MIKKTVLLISDEAMPDDTFEEIPARFLSLFTSPVIQRDDIRYPDFAENGASIEEIGEFTRPIQGCTVFAFRSDWQDINTELEVAYIKENHTDKEISLIGMYSEDTPKCPDFIKSVFESTPWEQLPVLTHETFRFYMDNLGMYVTMQAIPYLGAKYSTKIGLSTHGYEEWCPTMNSVLDTL
jgi:hypothetical protein